MRKFLGLGLMIIMIFAISGCSNETNLEVDLTDPEIVENCDENDDGVVTEEEFEDCEWAMSMRIGAGGSGSLGGDSSDSGDENDEDGDSEDAMNNSEDENGMVTSVDNIGDVKAVTDGITVTFDSDTGVALIEAEGETVYQDTDGYMYSNVEGWKKIKMVGEGGLATQSYPELADADYQAVDAPSGIPIADMPYKALYPNIIQKYEPTSVTCASGEACEEVVTDEGGVLRFDDTLRLVEAVLDGQLVTFIHGEYDVAAPAAQEITIPGMPGGMNMGF